MYVRVSGPYKPRRDIPIAVRELKTFSPSTIRNWVREHKTRKDRVTGKRVQVNVTPESITMWFKRHPDVLRRLKVEVVEKELEREAISETMLENCAFFEVASIKDWIIKLRAKSPNIREESINNFVRAIKHVCMGHLRVRPKYVIEGWGLKHPDRLSLRDAMLYVSELQKKGYKTRNKRLALRSFLKAKNVEGWNTISGQLEDAGKYAHLFISKEKINEIFERVKELNYTAYEAIKFVYKCGGARKTAILNAHSKDLDPQERTIRLYKKASRGQPKRIVEKVIPADIWKELSLDNRKGKLFDITSVELNALLRQAYREIIPELAKYIPRPFHFWRHQFAQHMLRATCWNYGLVARLGHWTVETLERYYGEMDRKTAYETGRRYLAKI